MGIAGYGGCGNDEAWLRPVTTGIGAAAYVPHPRIRYFTLSQVAIAKEVCSILLSDLSHNHTAQELAERFQIGGNQFEELLSRGIWRKSLCLAPGGTDAPGCGTAAGHRTAGAEIAAQVGYENQSKFAAVFARQFAARRWNIAEGHGSIEPCPFLSDFKKRYTSAPFSRHWALSL